MFRRWILIVLALGISSVCGSELLARVSCESALSKSSTRQVALQLVKILSESEYTFNRAALEASVLKSLGEIVIAHEEIRRHPMLSIERKEALSRTISKLNALKDEIEDDLIDGDQSSLGFREGLRVILIWKLHLEIKRENLAPVADLPYLFMETRFTKTEKHGLKLKSASLGLNRIFIPIEISYESALIVVRFGDISVLNLH